MMLPWKKFEFSLSSIAENVPNLLTLIKSVHRFQLFKTIFYLSNSDSSVEHAALQYFTKIKHIFFYEVHSGMQTMINNFEK